MYGFVDEEGLAKALAVSDRTGQPLGQVLVEGGEGPVGCPPAVEHERAHVLGHHVELQVDAVADAAHAVGQDDDLACAHFACRTAGNPARE